MARTIPSLTSGLQTIVTGTAETTRAILEATGTGSAEVIPMKTLNILSQVSETISHSLSYYSIEVIPLESGVVDIETSNVGGEPIDTNHWGKYSAGSRGIRGSCGLFWISSRICWLCNSRLSGISR